MNWHQMNDLDELTYHSRALLSVVQDGLLNQDCPANPEDAATILGMVIDKVDTMREINEDMWNEAREKHVADYGADNADADGEEDSDSEELLPSALWEDEEDNTKLAPRFDVEEVGKNEDGSATYVVNASDEDMKKLFEAFFTQAVINGIKYTVADNKKEVAKIKALEVAREFEVLLRTWETSDSLDYEPDVRRKREELQKALEEAGK